MSVSFTLDGLTVFADEGETLLDVARRENVEIPHLCWTEGLAPAGNCRACVVEVGGERVLSASCCRRPFEGMQVQTGSERARRSQRLVLELLQADLPETAFTRDSEVDHWSQRLGVGKPRFTPRERVAADLSHPAIAVNLDACIQCTRCVRACRDEQANDVIGLAFRGEHAQISFDLGDAMGASTCVACGECVQACPTGALSPANGAALQVPDRTVDSVCPYCGVGCQLTYHVKDDRILHVEGRDGPANHGRLCVKGRYGFDYARHPQRLTVPLIRRADAPRTPPPPPTRPPRGRSSGKPAGRRRWPWPAARCGACATSRALRRSQASVRPRAATRRPTSSRSSCGWASAATTSTTARGCAMRPACRRCSRASAPAPSATP